MGLIKFFLIKVVVDNEKHCREAPGNRIAHQDGLYPRPVRHCQEDPQDPQDTHTRTGHDHGNQHIAHTSQGAGQDFDENEKHVGRCDDPYDLHADPDNLRVRGKQLKKILPQEQQQGTDQPRLHLRLKDIEAIKSSSRQTLTLFFIRSYFPAP